MLEDLGYRCPKCGCDKYYIKQMNTNTGLYCYECNAWIKWLTYQETVRITKGKGAKCPENCAVKVHKEYGGVRRIKCSNCNTWLYSSNAVEPEGQFNLVNAKFCPVCGKEFI